MVDRILTRGGAALASLSGIAAGIGPGSFTGVRVSVAVAQGLAFGADLPVAPVTSLEALALEAIGGGAEHVLACLDARMGEVYWGCFAADARGLLRALGPLAVGPPSAVRLPDAAADSAAVHYRGIGRGFAAYPELASIPGLSIEPDDRRKLPQAAAMARLGALRFAAGAGMDPALLEPLYVRDKVAMTEAERAAARRVDK
jgi:tRNA threonylcarbamoyladenosine biosynthesis protein TsaB